MKKDKPTKPGKTIRAVVLMPSEDGSHVNVHYAIVTSRSRIGDKGTLTMTTGTPDSGLKLTHLMNKLPLFAAFLSNTRPETDADNAYYKAHETVNMLGDVRPK